MHTLSSLRNEVLGWLDEAGDAGTTATNVDNAIRNAHHRRVSAEKWSFMLYPKQTFSLTGALQTYALHSEFGRPLYFYNQTQREFLEQVPPRQFTDENIDWVEGVSDNTFTLWGVAPVATQPTSATTLTIVSTSASDNSSTKAVVVRGETSTGAVISESLTPSGTSPVTSLNAFVNILNVTLSGAWTGTLTLATSGGTTLLQLSAGELGRQYQQMRLLWIPSGNDVIEYQFYRKPSPLTADNDVPDIPHPFSAVLVWDALLDMAAYDNQVEQGRMAVWAKNQKDGEVALAQAFLEPQSLKSRARYVKYRGD